MLDALLTNLAQIEWAVHIPILLANLLLLFFSKPVIERIDPGQDHSVSVRLFVVINILFMSLHLLDIALMTLNYHYQNLFIKLAGSLMIVYSSIMVFKVGIMIFRQRFGIPKRVDGQLIYIDTYSSRIVGILYLVTVLLLTVFALISLWNLDSMLEATGIFGILIGFAALTSSVWAPDIVSGLIILNSKILEDGDVVKVDGYPDEYIIHKVSFIHTVLYDIRNNHRTFIRNKRFIESKIDNLSRVASTDGIRKAITYKIGYPDLSMPEKEARLNCLTQFEKRINELFSTAYQLALECKDLKLKDQRPFDWRLTCTGDYALEYTLFVYLKVVPSTKVTSTARRHLLTSLDTVNSLMLKASAITGVQLQTPDLLSIERPGSTALATST